jgi:hypothetical protein
MWLKYFETREAEKIAKNFPTAADYTIKVTN